MILSKIIVECFVDNLSLEELREFQVRVLIPQKATALLEHALAAEKLILAGSQPKKSKKRSSNV